MFFANQEAENAALVTSQICEKETHVSEQKINLFCSSLPPHLVSESWLVPWAAVITLCSKTDLQGEFRLPPWVAGSVCFGEKKRGIPPLVNPFYCEDGTDLTLQTTQPILPLSTVPALLCPVF